MEKTVIYKSDALEVKVLPDGIIHVENGHHEVMDFSELQARELREVINEKYPEEIIQVKV